MVQAGVTTGFGPNLISLGVSRQRGSMPKEARPSRRTFTSMLLSITTTHQPATDLGYLLGKNPDRCQSFELAYGKAHVFYPEATAERCTGLPAARHRSDRARAQAPRRPDDATLDALRQRSAVRRVVVSERRDRAGVRRCHGGTLRRSDQSSRRPRSLWSLGSRRCRAAAANGSFAPLFEPLGYEVSAERHPSRRAVPEWGEDPIFAVELRRLRGWRRSSGHLYVLLPVLDDEKHYWVGEDEVEKLLRTGRAGSRPTRREEIVRRYLKHQRKPDSGSARAAARG